jgi:hypothetical protein
MLNRIISRVHPATVISTVALFVALGGGYALAFSGSGSLQKGALFGIPGDGTPVRSLTGVGEVQALCESGGDIKVWFNNHRTEQLRYGPNVVIPAQFFTPDLYDDTGGSDDLEFHISPADADKAPQLDVLVRVDDTNNCATSAVYVLALNTQQP